MILPIYTYGQEVLRKKCEEITADYPELSTLIANMYETMYASNGIGIAAPQIGVPIRLFIVDTGNMDEGNNTPLNQVFINPTVVEEWDTPWKFEEGCLSIPGIRENVSRNEKVKIKFQDLDFNWHERTFSGMAARVIQHEYDHIEGVLFIDRINPLRKKLIQTKLKDMSKGYVKADYKIKAPRK
jgi:peptide deformylase